MTELVRTVALVEAGLFALLATALVLAVWLRMTRASRLAPRLASAAAALRAAALGTSPAGVAAAALLRVPTDARIDLIEQICRELRGAERERVAAVADILDLVAPAMRSCRDPSWWLRLRAVRTLAVLNRGESVVPPLLADPEPLVRAEAAYWVGETGHVASAFALVRMVIVEEGLPLFAAQDALTRLGAAGAAAINVALGKTTEPPRALMRLAAAVSDPAALPTVVALAADGEYRDRDLAVEALAGYRGPAVESVLTAALDDGRPEVRAAAAAGIGRIGGRNAAPRLARAVSDRSWDVRRAAALALYDLRPEGLLYLREIAGGADRFAADVAEHVLGRRAEGR